MVTEKHLLISLGRILTPSCLCVWRCSRVFLRWRPNISDAAGTRFACCLQVGRGLQAGSFSPPELEGAYLVPAAQDPSPLPSTTWATWAPRPLLSARPRWAWQGSQLRTAHPPSAHSPYMYPRTSTSRFSFARLPSQGSTWLRLLPISGFFIHPPIAPLLPPFP